jgi:peptidoglycan/xylan/chitin deacetylase (PgdA/CDA1 family)
MRKSLFRSRPAEDARTGTVVALHGVGVLGMGKGQRRNGRLVVAVLLAGAMSLMAPAAQAAPAAPSPAPTDLPEGPWPPSEVLAADPATVATPRAAATLATTTCPAVASGVNHSAPGSGKTVALTFDDGPGVSTAAIMSVLENARVAATFFNIGVNQTVRPATVQAEFAHGYLLGNHTWSHPQMQTLSAADQAAEMDRTTSEQVSLVGSPPCFFRPPYGSYNSTTLSLAQARHMSVWNWSVDTEDWKANGSADAAWVNRIISLGEAGGSQTHPVVLMHNSPTGNPATVAALPTLIKFYRDRGYTFVDLNGHVAGRAPFGHLDTVRADGTGRVSVSGWTIDPDTPTVSTRVHMYVDGKGTAVTANGSRADVAAAHPEAGPLHGFTAAQLAAPGAHTVCVYAIDTTVSSVHTNLGCRTVTVTPHAPYGSFDTARASAAGGLTVSGWTIDPDTPTVSTRVHVYVDSTGTALTANLSRTDVAAAHPEAGPLHGFVAALAAAPGTHTVCVYAIDTSFSSVHTNLGCKTVTTN